MFIYWLIVLIFAAVAYWYLSMPKNLPPGLLGLPFIGSVFDFWDASEQHVQMRRHANKYGPVYSFYIINKLFVVLTDFDAIHEAFVKQGDVCSGAVRTSLSPETGIGTMDGERWKQLRRIEHSFLNNISLRRPILDQLLQEEADKLIQLMLDHNGTSFDPNRLIARSMLDILFKITFGHSCTNEEIIDEFICDAEQKSSILGTALSPILMPTALTRFGPLIPWVRKYRQDSDDFAALLRAELDEAISTFDPSIEEPTNYVHTFMKEALHRKQDILDDVNLFQTSCMDFVMVPAEPLIIILHHTLKHLMVHPEIQDRIDDEIRNFSTSRDASIVYSDRVKLPFLEATVMEGLRISDVAPLGLAHRVVAPMKLYGYDVPEDTLILGLLTNILKNEERHPHPDTFDPYRFLDENGRVKRDPQLIPFVTGRRMCLGDTVSKMIFFVFIGTLCNRLVLQCPPEQPKPNMKPRVIATSDGNATVASAYEMCVKVRM